MFDDAKVNYFLGNNTENYLQKGCNNPYDKWKEDSIANGWYCDCEQMRTA